MTFTPFRRDRHLIPRWRSFERAVASGDLVAPRSLAKNSVGYISLELRRRLEAWRSKSTTINAAEVVETAIVEGNEYEGVKAARTLLAPDSTATALVRRQAELLLERTGFQRRTHEKSFDVATARRRTREFPRDAYAWTDLALAFTIHGKNEHAKRAMQAALQLAPYDRHVLRAAARLHLHTDDPERAHDLLKNNPATRSDPWLIASEVAVSALAERKPTFLKSGVKLIEDGGLRPRQVSELAASIGTVHLRDGNRKARKMFTTSLIDPTGNALAQAEWASPEIGDLIRPRALESLNVSDSAEARAFQEYWDRHFDESLNQCEIWHLDEPYSSRPYLFGSGIAITLEQFEAGLAYADRGLAANPNEPSLCNNKAYALIALGRYEEASRVLIECRSRFPSESAGPVRATMGMLSFRTGDSDAGRKWYGEAITYFRRSANFASEALAHAYFALEAARAGLSDAAQILQEAEDHCKKVHHLPEADVVLGRARSWLKAIAMRREPASA